MSVAACASHIQGGRFVAAHAARCSSPTASTCSGLSRATSTSSVLSAKSGNLTPDMPARRPRLGATVCRLEVPFAPRRAATAMRPRPTVAEQPRSATAMRSRPRACSDGCLVAPAHSEHTTSTVAEQPQSTTAMRSRPRAYTSSDACLAAPAHSEHASPTGLPMLPGDILFVKGNGHLAEIGTTGGFMGHVLLVLAPPVPIPLNSREAFELQDIWPAGNVQCIWRIPTVESTRANIGLYQSQMLAHLELGTGRLILIGEIAGLDPGGTLSSVENEIAELWQSPMQLRVDLRASMMADVLADMLDCQSSWSLTTAARAVFKSAGLSWSNDEAGFMSEVQESWETAPICTSVVISFWQRYLCKCARVTGQSEMHMILKWMPLKADRGLPGELIAAMQRSGWKSVNCAESILAPHALPPHSGLGQLAVSPSAPCLPSRPPMTVPPRTPVSRMRSDSAVFLSPGSRFRTLTTA